MPRPKKVESEAKPKSVLIPPIKFEKARITLVGDTPLLVNRFDEKSKREMEDKTQKRAKGKRDFGSPEEQMKRSLYPVFGKKGVYGIPAGGIRNCAVSASRFIDGLKGTIARGAFQIVDDVGGLVPITGPAPVIDERIVRVGNFGNKKPCVRYRGRFDKWELTFTVKYNAGVISAEQIANLYENAGFAIGLCEYRPEKNGNCGMFHVKRK